MRATRITFKRIAHIKNPKPFEIDTTDFYMIENAVMSCLSTMQIPLHRVSVAWATDGSRSYAFMEHGGIKHPVAEWDVETFEKEGEYADSDYWTREDII